MYATPIHALGSNYPTPGFDTAHTEIHIHRGAKIVHIMDTRVEPSLRLYSSIGLENKSMLTGSSMYPFTLFKKPTASRPSISR